MKQKGRITNWNDDKGFGFITPVGGGKQIFIHIKAFRNWNSRLEINQIVSYDISKDNQGRVCAQNASSLRDKSSKRSTYNIIITSIVIISVFAVFLALSVLTGKISVLILAFYSVVSLLTFIMYAKDKSASQNGDWRTPESTYICCLLLAAGLELWPCNRSYVINLKKNPSGQYSG